MNHIDARARYTRMIIEKNFLSLLEEKPANKITVTELCRRAQINRATFYKHYQDISDLLERLVKQVLQQLQSFLEEHSCRQFDVMLLEALRYIYKEGMRYRALGSAGADPALPTKIFALCYRSAYPVLEQKLPGLNREEMGMLYHYLAQGCGGVLAYWIRNGMKLEPEVVADFISESCVSTVKGFTSK